MTPAKLIINPNIPTTVVPGMNNTSASSNINPIPKRLAKMTTLID